MNRDASLIRFLEALDRPAVAVVGDLMLDEYVWGGVERISPEAPIPVFRVGRRETRAGGAGSVVVNLARLGADVEVFGVLGDDEAGRRVLDIFQGEGCRTEGIVLDATRRTTVKTRLLGYVQQAHRAVQQMLRIDEEDLAPIAGHAAGELADRLRARTGRYGAILVSDYAKGLLTPAFLRAVFEAAGDTPVLVDPARISDYSRYRGAYLVCPNRFEAELATGIACRTGEDCERAARVLEETCGFRAVAVTLDRDGIYLYAGGRGRRFPTEVRTVTDVTGAGDMVLTILGLVTAGGGSLEDAVSLANIAAGIEIRHLGVYPVSRGELIQELRYRGHPVVGKVKALAELARIVEKEKEAGKTVVFTNGCFDLLHAGHHHLLNSARREGDLLIVALNSDASIRRLKGPGRPVIPQEDRVKMVAGLEAVDYVIVFDEDTPNRLLETLRPHVLVKGSEYRDGVVVGREIVEGYGGRVAFVEQLPGFSTTGILEFGRRGDKAAARQASPFTSPDEPL